MGLAEVLHYLSILLPCGHVQPCSLRPACHESFSLHSILSLLCASRDTSTITMSGEAWASRDAPQTLRMLSPEANRTCGRRVGSA